MKKKTRDWLRLLIKNFLTYWEIEKENRCFVKTTKSSSDKKDKLFRIIWDREKWGALRVKILIYHSWKSSKVKLFLYYFQSLRWNQLFNLFSALMGWPCFRLFNLIVGLAIGKVELRSKKVVIRFLDYFL